MNDRFRLFGEYLLVLSDHFLVPFIASLWQYFCLFFKHYLLVNQILTQGFVLSLVILMALAVPASLINVLIVFSSSSLIIIFLTFWKVT